MTNLPEVKKLYRYESILCIDNKVKLILHKFDVIKSTRCGVWIEHWATKNKRKFILLNSRKQYAYETKEDAFNSFRRRKKKYVQILKNKLLVAEASLKLTMNDTITDIKFTDTDLIF